MGHQPFETVVEAHHGEIFRYLQRLTAHAADDLSQETFLRAYRAYPTLAPDANVRAWLFTIATNLARNHFRDEKRRRTALTAAQASRSEADADAPDGQVILGEARARVEAVVDRLPLKQRAAFVLRKVHDLDYDAIARSLDCSVDSARAHVFQALKKIRHSLTGHQILDMEISR
jgi:RNA polymerase sigma-70 factor (ECF subfamily)